MEAIAQQDTKDNNDNDATIPPHETGGLYIALFISYAERTRKPSRCHDGSTHPAPIDMACAWHQPLHKKICNMPFSLDCYLA
eukprot:6027343-Amphidinium_carterae.1